MWFIKIDDDLTLEDVCEANGMEPKALYNPLHEGVLNIVLRDANDVNKTGSMVYTNITLNFENIGLTTINGVPHGEIDKDISGISLYIDEDNYELADYIMNNFDENGYRAMMAKL